MTDRDRLLAGILEAPEDDAPRLVYADWLDENGQPERAEFIRLQCELARVQKPSMAYRTKKRILAAANWSSLVIRERGFLLLDWRLLAPDFPLLMSRAVPPQLEGHAHVVFVRGFIESVTMSAADWLQWGDSLSWSPEQTEPCPECGGTPTVVTHDSRGSACRQCKWTGRVSRPCPATAQPILSVRLTTWPEFDDTTSQEYSRSERLRGRAVWHPVTADGRENIVRQVLRAEWPAVETWHLPPEPEPWYLPAGPMPIFEFGRPPTR